MSNSGDPAVIPLSDQIVEDPAIIGPIELRVSGSWDRIERVIAGLPHEAVQYSWRLDSTGKPALFIEIPLTQPASSGTLLRYRDSIREAITALEKDRPVYVHFVGADAIGA